MGLSRGPWRRVVRLVRCGHKNTIGALSKFHVEHRRDVISLTYPEAFEWEEWELFKRPPGPLRITGCSVAPEALFWARHILAYRKGSADNA